MRQLPGASNAQHKQLNESPTDDTSIGRLRLVTERSLALTHHALLTLDEDHLVVQSLDLLGKRAHLLLLLRIKRSVGPHDKIDIHLDFVVVQPASTQCPVANTVLSLVSGSEDKIALCIELLEKDTVVIVKGFLLLDVESPIIHVFDERHPH